MHLRAAEIASVLRCPLCRAPLRFEASQVFCSDNKCRHSIAGFPVCNGQPVLIDFNTSIFDRTNYEKDAGSVLERDTDNSNLRVKFGGFVISGNNPVAGRIAPLFVSYAKRTSAKPTILVVGGGAIGSGAECLYTDPEITLIGTDVYASPNTQVVADAHQLPFDDASFDGVWIQAVLEHVLEPHHVVEEICRVLKPEGVVYADTPFMQQVHEGAYDFTRFTLSGHRWLFRNFSEIESSAVCGAGTATVWSLRYLWKAFGLPSAIATLLTLPFFWMRYLDRFTKAGANMDAASSVYFFGFKSQSCLQPKDMPAYYAQKQHT